MVTDVEREDRRAARQAAEIILDDPDNQTTQTIAALILAVVHVGDQVSRLADAVELIGGLKEPEGL